MRGDSIRDLYAKTMALLGLGVLAGAGALVDYWPVGVTFPPAAAALAVPSTAAAFGTSPEMLLSPDASVSQGPSKRAAGVPVLMAARVVEPLPIADTPRIDIGRQVSLAEPAASFASALHETTGEPALVITPDYQSAALLSDGGTYADGELLAPVDDGSDGLITGAFKKAGNSIVKTGLRTGASLFDAARVIGGAVRKALPN